MTLTMRKDNSFSGLVEQVKAQVWSIDSQIPVSDVQTMEQRMAEVFCTAAVLHAPARSFCVTRGGFGWRRNLWRCGLYSQPEHARDRHTDGLGGQRRDVLRLIMA